MSNRVLSYVIGSNGAGKSTLARNVLGTDIIHKKIDNLGYLSLSEYNIYNNRARQKIVAIGRYTSACGGCDTVKPLFNVYHLGVFAASEYPEANIFMEGVIMSELFSSPLKFFLEMEDKYGFEVEICFLYASMRESMRRVFERNGGNPIKSYLVSKKLKSTSNCYKKFMEIGKFRCIAIDTTNITTEEVFSKFRNWSGLYEKNTGTA